MVTVSDTLTFLRKDVTVTVTVDHSQAFARCTGDLPEEREALLAAMGTIEFLVSSSAFRDYHLNLYEILAVLRIVAPVLSLDAHLRLVRRYINLRAQAASLELPEATAVTPQESAKVWVLQNSYLVRIQESVDDFLQLDLPTRRAARDILGLLEEGQDEEVARRMASVPYICAHQWVIRLRREPQGFKYQVMMAILSVLNPGSPILQAA